MVRTKKTDNLQEKESQDIGNTNAEKVKQDTDQEKIIPIDPDELESHEKNTEIYGDEPVDLELLKSIKENGQLVPIVVTRVSGKKKLNIVSGHRRWKAILEINEEKKENEEEKLIAKCYYRTYETDFQIEEAIIEYNRQRKKVPSQIYQEVKSLDKILSEKAKQRQKRSSVVPNLAQQNKEENGRTIEQEADTLGMGKETLRKLKFIGDVCFQNNPKVKKYEKVQPDAANILKELDEGKLSYDAAYNKLMLIAISEENIPESSYAGKLVGQIYNGEKFRDNVWKKFETYKTSIKNDIPKDDHTETDNETTQNTYSVIVTDLTKFTEKEAKATKFTDSKNAALFLWADASNIKDRINLLEKCSFTLKSIGIWKNETFLGTYFDGTIEFLLLGIKENIVHSDFKPFIILNNENDENKSRIYEIAEKMFPNETYVDLDKDPNREGWNGHYSEENFTYLDKSIKNDEVNELV